MLLLNFSHPLTPAQLDRVEVLTAQKIEQVINLAVQFDNELPFPPQLEGLINDLDLPAADLQTAPILVNLPSLNFITAMLLAELHGRMGYFPPILRLRPAPGSLPPTYEVAEVINLQNIRDSSRKKRFAK